MPVEEAQIAEYLLRMFRLYDRENTGRLHLVEVAAALRESDVGLSQLQLQAVLSEANADDEDGTVNYRAFAVSAAGLISAMISVASDAEAASRIVEMRSRELSTVRSCAFYWCSVKNHPLTLCALLQIMGMDSEAFKAQLTELLAGCTLGDTGRGE